ncbi:MAG: flavocytochrome c [Moorea sp. SIO3C2]|nr:flavocytochrome c [Moorena sp. SIO3C2]
MNKSTFSNWDTEPDVVVVGSGVAGLAAAVEAKNAGASVVVLEKRSSCGGNSIMSDGGVALAGTDFQKQYGILDSWELMYEDMLRAGLNMNDASLAKIVAQQSNSVLEWLTEYLAVKFRHKPIIFGGHSVPRIHLLHNFSGTAIVKPLLSKVKELGIEIKTNISLTNFGKDVREIEVYDKKENQARAVYANTGVVLATGGFGGDVAFRILHDPRLTSTVGNTNRLDTTAEGMLEAIKIGASSVHLEYIQLSPWSSPDEKGDKIATEFFYTVFPYGIVVHPLTGKRFFNELADRKIRADSILDVGQPSIGITDLEGMNISGHSMERYLSKNIVKRFEDLEELAAAYSLPYQALKETLDRYNKYVENKKDESWQKPIPLDAKPLHAPYYAMRLWPKVHYTMGGVTINDKAQVIDNNGQAIKGLYAAGEVTGGIHGASRLGGSSLTECLVFGRIAGKNAALQKFTSIS